MRSKSETVAQFLEEIPADRKPAVEKLREVVRKNLPKGFSETIGYGMLGYVVPHEIYPAGYHCDPKLPLPFINIASQKNFIALYHMGIYASPEILQWFVEAYPKHSKGKLDMGKSCIRFKKADDIPYPLIAELMTKFTVQNWIDLYEKNFHSPSKKK